MGNEDQSIINTEALKQKLQVLEDKNKELNEKLIFQAAKLRVQAKELAERASNTKVYIAGKSLWQKIKALFTGAKVVPEKKVISVTMDDLVVTVMGYLIHNRACGTIIMRDAQVVDLDSPKVGQHIVIKDLGNIEFIRENVEYIQHKV
jgi:hypothetical protein